MTLSLDHNKKDGVRFEEKNYYKMENINKVKDYFQKIQTGSDFKIKNSWIHKFLK